MRILLVILTLLLAAACGGGAPSATRTPARPTAAAATSVATAAPSANAGAAQLCFLTPADWQAFNYVTGASPDVTSDESVDAICQYASGLFLEVYTEASEADAEETYQTVLDNAPFDAGQAVTVPGADEAEFDPEVTDDHAGIAVRAGNLVFSISGLARDTALAELTALAGLVVARSSTVQ